MLKTIQNILKPLRRDGWQNIYTGLGTQSSRVNSTYYKPSLSLNQSTLTEIYKSNGIGKRIVNIVVDDAVRGFIEADRLLLKELHRVKTKQKIIDAGCFGRLFGGAILVAFVDDGLDFDRPLNLNKINKLISLKVFDRHQVSWQDDDLCKDFYKEHYGEPEIYRISSGYNSVNTDETFFKVHRSRCFVFGGERSTNNSRVFNQGWDESVLQSCYEALRNYGIVINSSAEIVQDFIQVIMKMSGLSDKVINGEDRAVLNRIDVIDKTKSVANLILLDGDGAEDYEKKASSVAGLADLWDRFSEAICAVTGIPATRLFGKSPSGLNSTGTSDLQNWYDIVRAYRGDQIEPCLNWLIDILKHQREWKEKPAKYEWEFPSLTAPTELEWAEIKKKYAEIDWGYIDRGAIDPVEVWQERFGSGDFHFNIKLTKPDIEETEVSEENEELLEPLLTAGNIKVKHQEQVDKTCK